MKNFQYVEMPMELNKKEVYYVNFIKEMNQKYLSKYEDTELDVNELLFQKNSDAISNEEYNIVGVFIEKVLVLENYYILLANHLKGINLVKIHASDFFDEKIFIKNKILLLTNSVLKAIYYPNDKITFSLFKPTVSFNEYSKLIVSLETTNYTSIKVLSNGKFKSNFINKRRPSKNIIKQYPQ